VTAQSDASEIQWLDLDRVAEVTIVAAGRRAHRTPPGWCRESPGEQAIEIRFHEPIWVSHLRVICSEAEHARTQEMTVWASMHRGERHREVLRRRFTFSHSATEEVEQHALDLEGVSVIELRIVPSIDGRPAVARVRKLQLASA
jgi:hypothetical protein